MISSEERLIRFIVVCVAVGIVLVMMIGFAVKLMLVKKKNITSHPEDVMQKGENNILSIIVIFGRNMLIASNR